MSDPFSHLLTLGAAAIPWAAFVAGLGGSLHCVGMCGGLVTACAPDKKSVVTYQLGRLLGYSILGLLAGFVGSFFNYQKVHPVLGILPALTIGAILIWWGLSSWQGKKAEVPVPRFISKFHMKTWNALVPKLNPSSKSFVVGLLSIFLPCGLLYAIVLTIAAFQDPIKGILAMSFFWLGTVPAMGLAPEFMRNVIQMIFKKAPKLSGVTFIAFGLLTISWRLVQYYSNTGASCH